MENEKQILAADIYEYMPISKLSHEIAEHLHAKGWCKIPEGAVVLTKEEIEALNVYHKKHFREVQECL